MEGPQGFFKNLLKRPTFGLVRRATAGNSRSNNVRPNDLVAFEKLWIDVHVSEPALHRTYHLAHLTSESIQTTLQEPDEKQILNGIESTPVPSQLKALQTALLEELDRVPVG